MSQQVSTESYDSFRLGHCVNLIPMRCESTSFNRIVRFIQAGSLCESQTYKIWVNKFQQNRTIHSGWVIVWISYLWDMSQQVSTESYRSFRLGHCVNLRPIRYESTSFNRIVQFIQAGSLFESQTYKIWVNKLQQNRSRQMPSRNPSLLSYLETLTGEISQDTCKTLPDYVVQTSIYCLC